MEEELLWLTEFLMARRTHAPPHLIPLGKEDALALRQLLKAWAALHGGGRVSVRTGTGTEEGSLTVEVDTFTAENSVALLRFLIRRGYRSFYESGPDYRGPLSLEGEIQRAKGREHRYGTVVRVSLAKARQRGRKNPRASWYTVSWSEYGEPYQRQVSASGLKAAVYKAEALIRRLADSPDGALLEAQVLDDGSAMFEVAGVPGVHAVLVSKAPTRTQRQKERIPETFFGYTDIIWSAVPSPLWTRRFRSEPAPNQAILRPPGWLRHTSYGFGATKAAAAADLKERRKQKATRFKKHSGGDRHFRWTAYHDYDRKMKTGTWGEVRKFLRDAITRIGGTDHVFLETVEEEEPKRGLPVYSLGLGS